MDNINVSKNKLTAGEWYDIIRGIIVTIEHSTNLVKESNGWQGLYRDIIRPNKCDSLKGKVEYFNISPYPTGYETTLCCSVGNAFAANEVRISTKPPVNSNNQTLKFKEYKVTIKNYLGNSNGAVFINVKDDGSYMVSISRLIDDYNFGSVFISDKGTVDGYVMSLSGKEDKKTEVSIDSISINPDSELNSLLNKALISYDEEINKLLMIYDKCLIDKRLDTIKELVNTVSGGYQKPNSSEIAKSFI